MAPLRIRAANRLCRRRFCVMVPASSLEKRSVCRVTQPRPVTIVIRGQRALVAYSTYGALFEREVGRWVYRGRSPMPIGFLWLDVGARPPLALNPDRLP